MGQKRPLVKDSSISINKVMKNFPTGGKKKVNPMAMKTKPTKLLSAKTVKKVVGLKNVSTGKKVLAVMGKGASPKMKLGMKAKKVMC